MLFETRWGRLLFHEFGAVAPTVSEGEVTAGSAAALVRTEREARKCSTGFGGRNRSRLRRSMRTRASALPALALESLPIPSRQVRARFVRALAEIHQCILRSRGLAHCVVWQEELLHIL